MKTHVMIPWLELSSDIDSLSPSLSSPICSYNIEQLNRLLINRELQPFVREDERELIDQLVNSYSSTIKLVNQRKFTQVEKVFKQTDSRINTISTNETYLYLKQSGLSAKAYYQFRRGNYKLAEFLTLECIAIAEFLIRKGVKALRYRCLNQNKNLAKVHFEEGNWQKGAELFGGILEYLVSGSSNKLVGEYCLSHKHSDIHKILNEAFVLLVFHVGVQHLLTFSLKGNKEQDVFDSLFTNFFQSHIEKMEVEEGKIIAQWLNAKNHFLQNRHSDFISNAVAFMNYPMSRDFDELKLSLADNIISLSKNSDEAATISRSLAIYVEEKLSVKAKLKALVIDKMQKISLNPVVGSNNIAMA